MRKAVAVFFTFFTATLIYALDRPWGSLPALGRLLDPAAGWAANAEAIDKDFNLDIKIPGLRQPVAIWLEDRMIPHLRAANDHDLYMTQGYIHAYFRLWQMDLQTRAAAGRVSEVVGSKAFAFDRTQRRKGMVYAAESSLKAIEADLVSKSMLDAYTAGVNAYIHSMGRRDLPLEYKLMGFRPEEWTNLKSALLMKYMADDLTGYTEDIPLTYLRDQLSPEEFNALYPERNPKSKPVIPKGTTFARPSLPLPAVPGIPDSLFVHFGKKPAGAALNSGDRAANADISGIGSNNWAVSGAHTVSGAPILCNDPHLGLNLPSLWFELQLTAPGINCYGVSLPGAPGIVIGFNDSISWGLTNNYRDVKDFYQIAPADATHYWFNGRQMPYNIRKEIIHIKDQPDFADTVRYTVHGPVMYEPAFPGPDSTGALLAMCWMAHRGTNELLALYSLNRATGYNSFVAAIMNFQCPAQNFVYADRSGNIAMWGQGQFINKWKGQGRYVMEGRDSLTLWGQNIPMVENPHVLNPPQGYLASANQATTDSTYPYWYNGYFYDFRAWRINDLLSGLNTGKTAAAISTSKHETDSSSSVLYQDEMQNDDYSLLVAGIYSFLPRLLEKGQWQKLHRFYPEATSENDYFLAEEKACSLSAYNKVAILYQAWWAMLFSELWRDRFRGNGSIILPSQEVTWQIVTDTSLRFISTLWPNDRDHFSHLVQTSFTKTLDSLQRLQAANSLEWYKVKNTTVQHLAKIPAFSYQQLKTGGWGNTINAMKEHHGPSWRMIVEMGRDSIRAVGVYPGGQSGNPGSKYYADFLEHWVEGKYYNVLFFSANTATQDTGIKYIWNLNGE